MSTVSWNEAKRRADETRRAAGHHIRTDAERAAGQRRLDDEIRAHRLAEVRRNRALTQREVADAMGVSGPRVSDVERGKLDTVSGVVFGEMPGCTAGPNEATTVNDVIRQAFASARYPVVMGLPTGHTEGAVTLPLGVRVRLAGEGLTLLESPFQESKR